MATAYKEIRDEILGITESSSESDPCASGVCFRTTKSSNPSSSLTKEEDEMISVDDLRDVPSNDARGPDTKGPDTRGPDTRNTPDDAIISADELSNE